MTVGRENWGGLGRRVSSGRGYNTGRGPQDSNEMDYSQSITTSYMNSSILVNPCLHVCMHELFSYRNTHMLEIHLQHTKQLYTYFAN